MTEVSVYHVYNAAAQDSENAPISAMDTEVPSLWPEMAPDIFVPAVPANGVTAEIVKSTVTPHFLISRLALAFAIVGFAILAVSYAPSLYFSARSAISRSKPDFKLSGKEVATLSQPAQPVRSTYQPPVNPRLPKINRLVIPAIGVKTDVLEATYDNYESALRSGVWRVSDFGAPSDNTKPTILAAHRYGYLAWTNLYRKQNSFFNLPKLKVGDVVEIDWNQRRYMYEIYGEGKGTEITDYSADLILYTCVELTGPERIFKYARLMEI